MLGPAGERSLTRKVTFEYSGQLGDASRGARPPKTVCRRVPSRTSGGLRLRRPPTWQPLFKRERSFFALMVAKC